jgi:hypothetical protein
MMVLDRVGIVKQGIAVICLAWGRLFSAEDAESPVAVGTPAEGADGTEKDPDSGWLRRTSSE